MSDFGLRIGLEGEREFKAGLRDINQNFKVLASEMKLVESQFDRNDKSLEAATARKQALNKEVEAQKDKITILEAALKNATDSFGENDKRTQAWAIQLNNVKAALNNMERDLDSATKAVDASVGGFDDAGEEVSDFADEIENASEVAEDAESSFANLGATLKNVGIAVGAAMVAIGTAATAAGKALFDIATETASFGNEVNLTAQKMGMSRQGVQEWDYILNQSGASLYNLSYGMRNLQNAMGGLDEDGGKVGKAIERLGLSFDVIREASPEEAMNAVIAAFQEMPKGVDKTLQLRYINQPKKEVK